MVSIERFKELCYAFPGVSDYQHFNRRAFKSKRIFVTLHQEKREANFMFNTEYQQQFCSLNPKAIKPLPNKWGLRGVTNMLLDEVDEDILIAGVEVAYESSVAK